MARKSKTRRMKHSGRVTKQQEPSENGAARGRILVLDDEPFMRQSVRENLRAEGYDVETSGNGFAALKIHCAAPFDLLLVDLRMPGMSGVEFLKRLASTGSMPTCIVLAGMVNDDERAVCEELGVTGILTKPVKREQLLEEVAAALAEVRQG